MSIIYVLKLSDSKYYIGKTTDLNNRLICHLKGSGSQWTKNINPKALLNKLNPLTYLAT